MDKIERDNIIDSAINYIKRLSMITAKNTTIESLNYGKPEYFDEVEKTITYSRAIIDNLQKIKETKEHR